MAQTKKQKVQAQEVLAAMPAKEAVDVKDQTTQIWNPDLFTKSKTYKDEQGNYQEVPAPWRKFNIGGLEIVAVEGENVSKKEMAVFEKEFAKMSKEDVEKSKKKYFSK